MIGTDVDRGMLAVTRAQALAKDVPTAVRRFVRALRDDASVEGCRRQIASLVDSIRDERFSATFKTSGTPRPVGAAVALALHRTTLEALTNVRKHAEAANLEIELRSAMTDAYSCACTTMGRARRTSRETGFGSTGIRERAEQRKGSATTEPHRMKAPHCL